MELLILDTMTQREMIVLTREIFIIYVGSILYYVIECVVF